MHRMMGYGSNTKQLQHILSFQKPTEHLRIQPFSYIQNAGFLKILILQRWFELNFSPGFSRNSLCEIKDTILMIIVL